ncbi:hypothetical protein RV01_GL000900 [Enterococcus dispar]|jgi:hypothetical protein|nr:hypothetical protein RV01_GL000900 [Enterococcus dispar]
MLKDVLKKLTVVTINYFQEVNFFAVKNIHYKKGDSKENYFIPHLFKRQSKLVIAVSG